MKSSKFYLLLISLLFFAACGPTKKVSFNIIQPAQITLPADAQTILLVDRTKYKSAAWNTIEGILTGELPTDDRVAVQEAMNTLKNNLLNSPRFNVKVYPERLYGNSMTAVFPDPLPWEKIDSLCASEHADIVVAMEVFDTDFIVTNGIRVKKRTVGEGNNKREEEYNEYYAQGVGGIDFGIRAYYAKDRSIVDQQMLTDKHTWEGVGNSPIDAVGALISKSNANKYLANSIGENYAYKISPMPVRISRSFYGKSKRVDEVAAGSRLADVNKWTEAIDTWKTGLQKAEKEKDKGILAYNIAIGYEVLGEYGTALQWAQDSYTKYGNKEGRSYVRYLQQRIDDENNLKLQMNK